MNVINVVSAIIRHGDDLVMVRQPEDNGDLYWFIPGGVVERGELLTDALRREVLEETGLTIDDNTRLAFMTQIDDAQANRQVFAFVFDASTRQRDLAVNDPDGLTHEAAFVNRAAAVERLRQVRWATMRDPLVAYLSGEAPAGCVWQYRLETSDTFNLVHKSG